MGRKSKKHKNSENIIATLFITLIFTLTLYEAYPRFFTFLLLIVLLLVILGGVGFVWYKISLARFKAYDISYLDHMDPFAFEEYICKLYKQLGYTHSYTTPKSGDFGADVIAENKCEKIAIQVKRYGSKNSTGSKAVQEVLAAKSYYGATRCAVLTTSYFTKQAKQLAKKCRVELIDRTDLKHMLMQLDK